MIKRPSALVRLLLACVFSILGVLPAAAVQQNVISDIQVHGNRRIPVDSIQQRMFTRRGDIYDQASIERDFNALWNTGYFEDLRIEREDTPKGVVLHVYVKEKPTIRSIEYVGLNSVTQTDVLDRFKKAKVGLSVESQYDPTKVKKAENALKELLAEHGRQFASVKPEVRVIPPAAVGITFRIKEGPKVKVGKIKFEGNKHIKSRELRAAMQNLKPIGIPHSIFFENLFSKTYDSTKLEEDAERVRYEYQKRGYFKALVADPKTNMHDTGRAFWNPFSKPGKAVDITLPIEEGERYKLGSIEFTGGPAVTNRKALRGLFAMKDGEWFNAEAVRKGLDALRKAFGELGYINFTAVPDTQFDDAKKLINLKIDLDQGRPFYVRRIEFTGNSTTRDKVIRRELALEEGQVYNNRLWELSILRLNQLGYFEVLKPEEATETHQNAADGTVDLTLKVREKGKNSIGLTGGVSGLAGSFIGINYETNNFLGLGETLSVAANVGSRERNIQFGFTQPYLFDRPIQFGFTVFNSKFDYNQLKEAEILANQQLNISPELQNTLQNYSTDTTGFSVSSSYALRHSFKRVGLSYSFDTSSLVTFSDASKFLFTQFAFRNVSGPDALKGVVTSKVLPSFSFSTIDSPYHPHTGKSLFVGGDIAGLGGNVKYYRPIVEWKQWIPMQNFRHNREGSQSFGYRIQGSFISGYGGLVAPPQDRFYIGGENDIRGFDIRSVSPYAFIADSVPFPLLNPDGSAVPIDPTNPRRGNRTVNIPIYRIVAPGGDTSFTGNAEYRIPIVGPVTVAMFADTGMTFALRNSELRLSNDQFNTLNTSVFGCPTLDATFTCQGGVTGLKFGRDLNIANNTNYVPRMSTGLELQVILPVVNAPFRIYYAYNPLILDTRASTPNLITRSMFPAGSSGDFSYQNALATFAPDFRFKEPRTTFRFTVSTTF